MKKILSATALAISFAFAGGASAQQVSKFPSVSLAGASSNASSAVATSSTNLPTIAFMFGYNGASWDQLQVDGSKFLKVNCAVGCSGGSFNNNADNVASSATNGQAAAFNYVWDGANWDRLYGDQTLGAWVNIKAAITLPVTGTFWQATQPVSIASMPTTPVTGTFWQTTQPVSGTFWQATQPISAASLPLPPGAATSSSYAAAFPATGTAIGAKNGANMVFLAADGSNNLDVNCAVGCGGSGALSNATSAVATTSTNTGSDSFLYGFNGTTWDQLQVNGSKALKIDGSAVTQPVSGTVNAVQSGTWNVGTVTTLPSLVAGAAIIGKVGIDQTTPGTTNGVQANAGTNLNTSLLALDTSVSGLLITQGTALGSNKGPLSFGSVTTAAPSYTTGQISPMSIDPNGNLRVTSTGGVGGFDNDVPITPTVRTAAYASTDSIGGLQAISVFRTTAQPSGVLNYVSVFNKNGAVTAVTVWAFDSNPTASTCTDSSATPMVLNNADLGKVIPGFPVVLAPIAAVGASQSQASQSVIVSVKNQDGSPTTNIYLCALANGAVTPVSTSDYIFKVSVAQD